LPLVRSGAEVRGERHQRREDGALPLRDSRAGDRFALALISLALDEVDATQVPDRRVRPGLPDKRVVADVCEARETAIAFAAKGSPASAGAGHPLVAGALVGYATLRRQKRSSAAIATAGCCCPGGVA
jgi:hypothetical protein